MEKIKEKLKKLKNNKKDLIKLLILTVVVSTISILVTYVVIGKNEIVKEVEKVVYVGKEEVKLDNFSKEGAVDALRLLFVEGNKDTKTRTLEERLDAIENNDMDEVLTKETIDKIYLSEEFSTNQYNRQVTASTVIAFSVLVNQNVGGEELNPVVKNFADAIYLDAQVMNAFVPLDVFVGASTGYSFEMQYVNGEWKLNPYSIIMSMKLSELALAVEE